MRDEACGGCQHSIAAQRHEASRRGLATLKDGNFIIELNSEVEERVNGAMDLLMRGEVRKARSILEALFEEHPNNHMVLYGIGVLLTQEGRVTDAVKYFDMAVEIYPYFEEAYFNMGVACWKLMQPAEGAMAFRKVVEVGDPDGEIVRMAREHLEEISQVIAEHNGISLDSYLEANNLFRMAYAHQERQEWREAIDGFREVLKLDKKCVQAHGNMGICLGALGRKAEALEELDRALELDPNYEPAISNRRIIESIEEGKPPQNFMVKSTEYYKEKILLESAAEEGKKKKGSSLRGRIANLFSK